MDVLTQGQRKKFKSSVIDMIKSNHISYLSGIVSSIDETLYTCTVENTTVKHTGVSLRSISTEDNKTGFIIIPKLNSTVYIAVLVERIFILSYSDISKVIISNSTNEIKYDFDNDIISNKIGDNKIEIDKDNITLHIGNSNINLDNTAIKINTNNNTQQALLGSTFKSSMELLMTQVTLALTNIQLHTHIDSITFAPILPSTELSISIPNSIININSIINNSSSWLSNKTFLE